jgi:hypothetical protein
MGIAAGPKIPASIESAINRRPADDSYQFFDQEKSTWANNLWPALACRNDLHIVKCF